MISAFSKLDLNYFNIASQKWTALYYILWVATKCSYLWGDTVLEINPQP
jgi:hypothetical protein